MSFQKHSAPTTLTTLSLLLLAIIPGLTAVAEIDEKWLEGIMIRESAKKGSSIPHPVKGLIALELTPFDPPGVNYGSNRTKAEMSLLLKSGGTLNTSVVIVALPSDPIREKQIAGTDLFVTDINVYDQVLPKMNNFLSSEKNSRKNLWLKSLELEKYTRLVLDDPNRRGYRLKNKLDGLNLAHCKVAVQALAKFHALSAVLKSKDLISVEPFDKSLSEKDSGAIGDWYGKVFTEFAKSIRAAWGPEWENTAKAFDEKSKTITQDLLSVGKRNDSNFNALLVGGFYINNLFFTDEAANTPLDVKSLNFQTSYWNSPALDLQMFLNTSPEPEIITNDSLRQKIVEHYATALTNYLKQFNYEGSIAPNYISSEIKRTELIGLGDALNFLSSMYLRPEDSAYTEQFIIDALKDKQIRIDSKGMILPRYIEVMKKLVPRAQKLGII